MTVKEFQRLKTTLKMEVELFLRERLYNPIKVEFTEFCRVISQYYRPEDTSPAFEAKMVEFAIKYGMEMIEREKCS